MIFSCRATKTVARSTFHTSASSVFVPENDHTVVVEIARNQTVRGRTTRCIEYSIFSEKHRINQRHLPMHPPPILCTREQCANENASLQRILLPFLKAFVTFS